MLTHEQAGFLGQDAYCYGSEMLDECRRLGLCGPDGKINGAGLKALAEYDAHHVTVCRWQLERALQLLSENLLDEGVEIKALRAALEAK